MELKIITVYCICDDLIKLKNLRDNSQCRMNLAEVMLVGIVSALFHRGNVQNARLHLQTGRYVRNMLSHSRINKRLLAIDPDLWRAVLVLCNTILSSKNLADAFVVDSAPIPACHPCRSWRCKLYQGKEYLGYCAAKKLKRTSP